MTGQPCGSKPGISGYAVAAALIVAGTSGCLRDLDPEVGAPVPIACDDADSDPGVAVSYSANVVPLLMEYCFSCHTAAGLDPIGIEIGGLDLSTYASLRAGGSISPDQVVLPGRPCTSVLVEKVSPSPPFGARMPRNGPPFLGNDEIGVLHDWIAEGAHEN
jgi:hypothetical protein